MKIYIIMEKVNANMRGLEPLAFICESHADKVLRFLAQLDFSVGFEKVTVDPIGENGF